MTSIQGTTSVIISFRCLWTHIGLFLKETSAIIGSLWRISTYSTEKILLSATSRTAMFGKISSIFLRWINPTFLNYKSSSSSMFKKEKMSIDCKFSFGNALFRYSLVKEDQTSLRNTRSCSGYLNLQLLISKVVSFFICMKASGKTICRGFPLRYNSSKFG